jgi:hypothetical protein
VKEVDAELLSRLSAANTAMGAVVLVLLESWRNDLDGGLPPTVEFRSLGTDLIALGRDLIARADQVDAITQQPQSDQGGETT